MRVVKLAEVIRSEMGSRSQAEVAAGAGISRSLLNDWVKERRMPGGKNFPQLLKLADYFGCTLEKLIFDSDQIKKEVLAETKFRDGGTEFRITIEKVSKD